MDQLKLKRVTRIDSIPASETYFTEQGFLHDTPIVTSTGIFEYATPDGGVRRELRLPEHVFDKESLASYAGKPVIITHKAGSIDKNNVMNEIVGTILSDGYQDGNDVRCKIVIHDIDNVKKTPYRELSLGYSLELIEEPGEWNGEQYDAIQTNIRINHLAIVGNARAGEQAHLNLDGKKVELDDKEIPEEGGKEEMQIKDVHGDGIEMTPEELLEAVKSYKEKQTTEVPTETPVEAPVEDPEVKDEVPVEPEEKEAETPVVPQVEPSVEAEALPEVEKTDGNVVELVATVKKLLEAIEGSIGGGTPEVVSKDAADEGICEEGNADSSEDKSQSMNNDSADDVFRQRLSICRIGDKLHMDGLEEKSIIEAKKEIIAKVLPTMRLDGKSKEYIDAAYDLAVGKVNERKDVDYQRQQMEAGATRVDSNDNVSMADSARQRMLEREGGIE